MSLSIDNINEYHSLYGGPEKKREVGNVFQALVNHYFKDALIFSIVETVNLNNPSIKGLGNTLFYTHTEDTEENSRIKEEYRRIIDDVSKKFGHTLAEYIDWYGEHTFFATHQNDNPVITKSKTSAWRSNFFANREEKNRKEEYGFIKYDGTENEFVEFAKDYLRYYISLLTTRLSFSSFPHFTVIVRPIIAKNKDQVIKLGNLYLHFATSNFIDQAFYERFLNDFLLIWMKEEGGIIINQITSNAIAKYKITEDAKSKSYLPAIWSQRDSSKFNVDLIAKIDKDFGDSGQPLLNFYEEVYIRIDSIHLKKLNELEECILNEFIPSLLSHKYWLKDGVSAEKIKTVVGKIKKNVETKEFNEFSDRTINLFVHLLALRHIVNIGFCCFGLSSSEIHDLLTLSKAGGEVYNSHTKKSYPTDATKQHIPTLTAYFTKLFIFSFKERRSNIESFKGIDAYDCASKKEHEFLQRCVSKIDHMIREQSKNQFNQLCLPQLKLNSIQTQKYNNDNVSRLSVFDFKQNWCDENNIIPELLKNDVADYLQSPILDCGAGLGDIAYKAFHDKEAILIDVNPIADKETKISPHHTIQTKSLFDFYPEKKIKTLLISHTLQFIDADVERLNAKIKEISPDNIVIVLNENNDIMGDLLKWTKDHYDNANPEERINEFPSGYTLVKSIPFQATVKCNSFESLAKQISYLMMFDINETGDVLCNFLKSKIGTPSFTFNQAIEVYQKNN